MKLRFRARVLLAILLCVVGYLSIQIYFAQNVSENGSMFSPKFTDGRDSGGQENSFFALLFRGAGQSKYPPKPAVKLVPKEIERNFRSFMKICDQFGMNVFLIDPTILNNIMMNVTVSASCKHICLKKLVISFGLVSKTGNLDDKSLQMFQEQLFDIVPVYGTETSAFIKPKRKGDTATHYIFHRKNHFIHLVIFFERASSYLWHGAITWDGDKISNELKLHPEFVDYGHQPGLYSKIDLIKVDMDSVRVFAPRFPLHLLEQRKEAAFIECNRTRANLFYSKGNWQLDDPQNLLFRKKARNLLARAKDALDKLRIPFWLSSGTTLGWYRQCDIIPYSKDVDIGIFIKNYDDRLIPAFSSIGLPLKHLFGKVEDSFELSFQDTDIKLDIFFFYEEKNHTWNGGTQARTGKKFKYIFPKFDMCWTDFLGLIVRVPCPTLPYVEANYGKHWFHPVRTWDWKKSPPNVQENGEWPSSERDKVIQLYD